MMRVLHLLLVYSFDSLVTKNHSHIAGGFLFCYTEKVAVARAIRPSV